MRIIDNKPTFSVKFNDTKYIKILHENQKGTNSSSPERGTRKNFSFYINQIKKDLFKTKIHYFLNENNEKCFRINNINQ